MTCRDPAAAGPVVARLDAAGATLLDVDSHAGSLERLFLMLTEDEQGAARTAVTTQVSDR